MKTDCVFLIKILFFGIFTFPHPRVSCTPLTRYLLATNVLSVIRNSSSNIGCPVMFLNFEYPIPSLWRRSFWFLNLILESRREIFIIQYKAYNSMNSESSDHCSKSLRLMLIFLPNCSFIICNKKKNRMDFWGYPSDLCLFADNPQNPVTDDEE